RLEHDGDGAHDAADGERAGVPHEHLRGMGVEPEKAERGAHQRAAEDRQLPGPGKEINAKIPGSVEASEEIREDRERPRYDRRKAAGEAVESVGQVDGV